MGLFGSSKKKQQFQFNLLPPPSPEELAEDIKRNRAFFYSITIPAISLIVAGLLFVLNALAVQATKSGWEQSVEVLRQNTSNPSNQFGVAKRVNGELKIKTDFISDPVRKSVDFELIFELVEFIFSSQRSATVTSYSRTEDGQFSVNVVSRREDDPANILEKFAENELISDEQLKNVQKVDGAYRFSVAFSVDALDVEAGGNG